MYTFSSHASAGTGARARRLVRLRHSAMALSIGVLLAAPAYAQQAPLTNAGGSAVDLDTVEVRGVRASVSGHMVCAERTHGLRTCRGP